MKHKVSDLSGALLDAAVARAARVNVKFWGAQPVMDGGTGMPGSNVTPWTPSTDWAQGGPVLDLERIERIEMECIPDAGEHEWAVAIVRSSGEVGFAEGPTKLIALMRAVVFCHFGEEVELP